MDNSGNDRDKHTRRAKENEELDMESTTAKFVVINVFERPVVCLIPDIQQINASVIFRIHEFVEDWISYKS